MEQWDGGVLELFLGDGSLLRLLFEERDSPRVSHLKRVASGTVSMKAFQVSHIKVIQRRETVVLVKVTCGGLARTL